MPHKNLAIRRRWRRKYNRKYNRAYQKTFKGLLSYAYTRMRRRVEGKGHLLYKGLPICSREEFYAAFLNDDNLKRLWALWVNHSSNSKRKAKSGLKPTPDRIDVDKGYVIGNIRWKTYQENRMTSGAMRNRGAQDETGMDMRL